MLNFSPSGILKNPSKLTRLVAVAFLPLERLRFDGRQGRSTLSFSFCLTLLLAIVSAPLLAMETAKVNDVQDRRHNQYALSHAVIHVSPTKKLSNATLLISEGKVVSVTESGEVPAGFVEIDLAGRTVYPGLIDMHTHYGMPEQKNANNSRFSSAEILESTTPGAYSPNEAIKSQFDASAAFAPKANEGEAWRKLGFSSVLTFQADGLAKGTSAVVNVADESENESMLLPLATTNYGLSRSTIKQLFPISRMGAVAVLRQTYLDAAWYGAQNPRPFTDLSLESWIQHQSLPKIFTAFNWRTVLLADKIGDEFGDQYIIKGGGDEYQRIDLIKATGAALIVPVDFPAPMNVSDPYDAAQIPLSDLKAWELAPYNLARLEKAGIPFAITTSDANKDFWKHLRLAVKNGLSESTALNGLTLEPAKLIGMSDRLGTLEPGKIANFLITDGDLFKAGTQFQENWIAGERYLLKAPRPIDEGVYTLRIGNVAQAVTITQKKGKLKLAPVASTDMSDDKQQSTKSKYVLTANADYLKLQVIDSEGATRLGAWRDTLDGETGWQGVGEDVHGQNIQWSLVYNRPLSTAVSSEKISSTAQTEEDSDQADQAAPGPVTYPFVAFGWQQAPAQEEILFKHASVWTNEADGILQDADVLIKNGKIAAVGKSLSAKGARVIDATGKHLTSGIIDEHSHIALDSVNEFATNSSMVRMADVVNSEDIAIYRDLAGGVTASQLLHGSANPIGGQSAMVKLRWGLAPQELLIKGADPFIKFALGENVKRSSNSKSIRYPQTRMGVEQVYVDAFTEARAYEARWQQYDGLSRAQKRKAIMPRRDLAMETMLQILNGERFITSHSYVQSEINMLMHVSDQFNFRVNTFTHILEGYKVADKMAERGVGGSTFADWWGYKWEVRYAIPYNAALMQQAGVVVAINSDDAEMSRRLNQEAAKSIKYGGLTEEEAWKLVTLNPAKLLHLDHRMGSIKQGKDADLVLWSGDPLSVYSKVEKTLVDGRVYFDEKVDLARRAEVKAERARLIEKVRLAGDKVVAAGGKLEPNKPPSYKLYYEHEELENAIIDGTGETE